MKERPIIFSGAMVRALLDGSKTQTRRLLNPQPVWVPNWGIAVGMNGAWRVGSPAAMGLSHRGDHWSATFDEETIRRYATAEAYGWGARAGCPYGQPGDHLFVRENGWERPGRTASMMKDGADTWPRYQYDADGINSEEVESLKMWEWKRRPSIHMPRWASRITLEIESVRVERLQDISEADAQAEGCSLECMSPTGDDSGSAIYGPGGYLALWERLNGPESWNANPWVWVVSFRRIGDEVTG